MKNGYNIYSIKIAMKMQRRSKLLLENKGHRLEALLEKQTKPKHIGAI